jgi:two-component system, NarL family, sensor histidine kinase UhpB
VDAAPKRSPEGRTKRSHDSRSPEARTRRNHDSRSPEARTKRSHEIRTQRRNYVPLFARIVLANGVLLFAVGLASFLILRPGKVAEVETDVVLVVALSLVTLVNLAMVRRIVAPLQELTDLARRVDPESPGQRMPGAAPTSEAGDLALTFNAMLDRLERERAESARRVLAAHESERLRIAQELHDEVGQTLTAVLLQLGRAQEHVSGEVRAELGEAQEAARASLEDVRRIATDLRPETLNDLGLSSALAALSDSFSRRTGISVRRDIQNNLPQLTGERELAVYRVAQEALTNIARHSGSDKAALTLASNTGTLTLTVRDYGRGPPVGGRSERNGIRGMRERATLVGGELRIGRSVTGPGTELRLEMPLEGKQ